LQRFSKSACGTGAVRTGHAPGSRVPRESRKSRQDWRPPYSRRHPHFLRAPPGGASPPGIYTLAELPGGRTRVTFEYAWQKAPMSEVLAAPVVRAVSRRNNQRALERLAEQLRTRKAGNAGA
jgi:hypothetical protein